MVKRFIEPLRNTYARYERPISSLSLVLGFVFDAITLKRVDTFWENAWVLGHLLIIGVFIFLIHYQESGVGDEADPSKKHFWYVNILQFFFGGILSTYLVFYFRSADIFTSWPFMLLLSLAFVANESLKRHYVRFSFQISLFFLSIYSFFIFLVPVVVHRIGVWVFLASGILSLAAIFSFNALLFRSIKDRFNESKKLSFTLILVIFAAVNFLYFTDLIPPIPLSLKDAGVYHLVQKTPDGNYQVAYEPERWTDYFKFFKDFTKTSTAPVYAYSAVFSPKGLNLAILHEWQHYDSALGEWVTEGTVRLTVIGGRDGGFRTYSSRSDLAPGKWRVRIKTEQGQVIGNIRFNLIPAEVDPLLIIGVKAN